MERMFEALAEIAASVENAEELTLDTLPPDRTILLIVDMINGFARTGPLSSPRIGALIPVIAELSERCEKRGMERIAFCDSHTDLSPEFNSFPKHCVAGTEEAALVEELRKPGLTVIAKNSTNGFLEEAFLRWLGDHPKADHFILAGDCTDLCVLQLALTLKTHFNRLNLPSRVIVPVNAVDTYDAPGHEARLCGLTALYNMKLNGIEIVGRVQ